MIRKIVYTLIGFLIILLFISDNPNALAAPYQYFETIDMAGYDIDDIDSDGTNLLALYGGFPRPDLDHHA